jgi:hypothetical protein
MRKIIALIVLALAVGAVVADSAPSYAGKPRTCSGDKCK